MHFRLLRYGDISPSHRTGKENECLSVVRARCTAVCLRNSLYSHCRSKDVWTIFTPDIIPALVVGSNLSRVMAGKADFFPVLATTRVLVILHRVLALATLHWRWRLGSPKRDPFASYGMGALTSMPLSGPTSVGRTLMRRCDMNKSRRQTRLRLRLWKAVERSASYKRLKGRTGTMQVSQKSHHPKRV